jgi:hypothetical protein
LTDMGVDEIIQDHRIVDGGACAERML